MRKNEEVQATNFIRMMGSALIGGFLSLAICLIFLFLSSIGISSGWLNHGAMMQYTIAGCVIGGFFGGLFAVMHMREKTLIVGLMSACIQYLLIMSIGILMYPEVSAAQNGVVLAASCLAGGAIAGFLGGKPKKKRRK